MSNGFGPYDVTDLRTLRAWEALQAAGVGARVIATKTGVDCRAVREGEQGVIVSWGRWRYGVRIRRDGYRSLTTYHCTYWRPEAEHA